MKKPYTYPTNKGIVRLSPFKQVCSPLNSLPPALIERKNPLRIAADGSYCSYFDNKPQPASLQSCRKEFYLLKYNDLRLKVYFIYINISRQYAFFFLCCQLKMEIPNNAYKFSTLRVCMQDLRAVRDSDPCITLV